MISSPSVPCPAMTAGMVEGRHHDQPLLRDQPVDLLLRVVLAVADDADLGAEPADLLDLVLRHQPRHADDGAHAFEPRRMGQRPAVIAGRGGDHAARASRRPTASATALVAPRSLKLPVVWRCSSLRWTGTPASSRRATARRTVGVRTTRPAMRVGARRRCRARRHALRSCIISLAAAACVISRPSSGRGASSPQSRRHVQARRQVAGHHRPADRLLDRRAASSPRAAPCRR